MNNLLLPIGSVVKLNDSDELIMIEGYLVQDKRDPEKYFDYIGCSFPLGFSTEETIMLRHDDIEEVLFVGYQTNNSIKFRKKVTNIKEKIDSNIPLEEAIKQTEKENKIEGE